MANNLLISYDLHRPDGARYLALFETVRTLGNAVRLELPQFYVSSTYSASHAMDMLKPILHPEDKVVVIDTNNNYMFLWGLKPETVRFVQERWNQ